MEELSSWIFSAQDAAQVDAEIRPQVADSPRVKLFSERERFTKHMLSEEQKRILDFSSLDFVASLPATLVSDCSKLRDKRNRKAALSAAWMKLL